MQAVCNTDVSGPSDFTQPRLSLARVLLSDRNFSKRTVRRGVSLLFGHLATFPPVAWTDRLDSVDAGNIEGV